MLVSGALSNVVTVAYQLLEDGAITFDTLAIVAERYPDGDRSSNGVAARSGRR